MRMGIPMTKKLYIVVKKDRPKIYPGEIYEKEDLKDLAIDRDEEIYQVEVKVIKEIKI